MLNTWIFHLSLYIDEPGAWPATQRKGSAVRCNECGASAVCRFFVSSFFAKVWSQTWMIFCGFLYLWGISNLEQIIQVFFLHVFISHPGKSSKSLETLWTANISYDQNIFTETRGVIVASPQCPRRWIKVSSSGSNRSKGKLSKLETLKELQVEIETLKQN